MALEHGGHEKKRESHKGSSWFETALTAIGIGLATIVAAPYVLAAANIIIPQYLAAIGVGAGALYVGSKSGGSGESKKHGH